MKKISLSELIESVKAVAAEQGSDYFHVEVVYATSNQDSQLGETKGLFFKGYTPQAGWQSAYTTEMLISKLKEKSQKQATEIDVEIELETV